MEREEKLLAMIADRLALAKAKVQVEHQLQIDKQKIRNRYLLHKRVNIALILSASFSLAGWNNPPKDHINFADYYDPPPSYWSATEMQNRYRFSTIRNTGICHHQEKI